MHKNRIMCCAIGLAVALAGLPYAADAQGQGAPASAENQQNQRRAQQVQLAVPFGVVNGQLVPSGSNLMFVNPQQASNSFVIPRNNIRTLNSQGSELTVDLNHPMQYPGGQASRIVFRLEDSAGAQELTQWFQQTPSSAGEESAANTSAEGRNATGEANRTTPPNRNPDMSFQVKHGHFLWGSDSGRLLVTPSEVIYESVTHANSSRQWKMSDIKEIKRDGPYKLTIVPFSGDHYDFDLLGNGLSSDQYQTIVNRVTNARVKGS
jgi:hypothetical protein